MKLTIDGCRNRQKRLLTILAEKGLDGAVLGQREYVYYFTGHLHLPLLAAAIVITADGKVTLAADTEDAMAADELVPYEGARYCTMHCQQLEEAAAKLKPAIGSGKFGADLGGLAALAGSDVETVDICSDLLRLRKSKDPDEIDAIRDCIRITEVMYDAAKRTIGPGVDEVTAFAEILAAATEAAGEFLEHCGNDYQANAMGGKPRAGHRMDAGELYVMDVGPCLHGYHADNCRTFAVDAKPTDAQFDAWIKVDGVFPILEEMIKPGLKAVELYNAADAYFKDTPSAGMMHHLGHGFGMRPHEPPELNPRYDAVLEAGDVITMEPGLYWDELKAGMRLEENYLVTEDSVEKLTSYSRALR